MVFHGLQWFICHAHSESTHHIFFSYILARKMWSWLGNLINHDVHFNFATEIWIWCSGNKSPQCSLTIKYAFIFLINGGWRASNSCRFNNKPWHFNSLCLLILSRVKLSLNSLSATFKNSMDDFNIIKSFQVMIHPPKAPVITEVLWNPPYMDWIKVNVNGSHASNLMVVLVHELIKMNNENKREKRE